MGTSAAFHLAEAGVGVLLLERGQLAGGSTSKAAGGVRARRPARTRSGHAPATRMYTNVFPRTRRPRLRPSAWVTTVADSSLAVTASPGWSIPFRRSAALPGGVGQPRVRRCPPAARIPFSPVRAA